MSQIPIVAVIGTGAMGAGIAQVAAAAGHQVLLSDTRAGAAERAAGSIRAMFDKLAAKGKMPAAQAAAAGRRLRPLAPGAAGLAALAPAGVVIEAIVESLDAKRALWAALDRVLDPDCLLATNTSSLSLAAIAAALAAPERLVGMHFFNPAPLMELVEIVGSVATDPRQLDRAGALARAWGKLPVRARATPGFIVNRVARPFYAEGLRLLAEQACAPATLDAILREAAGFRMGPCELTDLIGQDVNFAVTRSVFEGFFFDPRFRPSLVQQELVEAGWLGRKSGRGFFSYAEGASRPAPADEPVGAAPERIALIGEGILEDALAQRLEAAAIGVQREPQLPTDVVLQISDGRTAAEAESAHCRRQPTLLVDLALDYTTVKRVAVAASPGCSDAACATAVGALQAAGFAVSRVRDLPGLVVLRTVAMLINEAADAVHFGIASAADVDLAMRKGVNYPLGPLEWADRLGPAWVVKALRHIGRHYGEDRYRLSPLLRELGYSAGKFHPAP
ncbi:MAG: 3-hydroxyacyl-CoA dehydrogenase [Terriglobales bacterium]